MDRAVASKGTRADIYWRSRDWFFGKQRKDDGREPGLKNPADVHAGLLFTHATARSAKTSRHTSTSSTFTYSSTL